MQWASSMTTSAAPAARCGRISSRNTGLLSRSGETSRTSTSPARTRVSISSHWVTLAEFMVTARIPARSAAATWSRIRASSGEMMTLVPTTPDRLRVPDTGGGVPGRQSPQPSRSSTVATKYTADLPQPVRWTTRARRWARTNASIARHWSSRRCASLRPTSSRRTASARSCSGEASGCERSVCCGSSVPGIVMDPR